MLSRLSAVPRFWPALRDLRGPVGELPSVNTKVSSTISGTLQIVTSFRKIVTKPKKLSIPALKPSADLRLRTKCGRFEAGRDRTHQYFPFTQVCRKSTPYRRNACWHSFKTTLQKEWHSICFNCDKSDYFCHILNRELAIITDGLTRYRRGNDLVQKITHTVPKIFEALILNHQRSDLRNEK